jgi:3-oxoadipate enol-lactonase
MALNGAVERCGSKTRAKGGRVPTRDAYVKTDGAKLRYREDGQGPAVIFIHGWTLDLDMWEPQSAALSACFRVIRLDRRGFGLSSGRPSLSDDRDDVRALCRHLDLRRVAVVGMSQGARVALALLCGSPEMISCLVLDGPPPLGGTGSPDLPYESYRELARNSGMEAFRREWAAHPLVRLRTPDRRTHELLARMLARYAGHDLRSENVPALAPCAPAKIQVPVLVLTGELDLESGKASADALASQAPRAERVQIPGAGHLCNLDNPTAYNAAIAGFLTRHAVPLTH